MKKNVLFFVLLATIGGQMQAQDTVWQKGPRGNYFYNNWVDTTQRYVLTDEFFTGATVVARQFFTEDTLQVYGIAAMMASPECIGSFEPIPSDTSLLNCQESLMLLNYDYSISDMQQMGESLPVHLPDTAVTYYMMSNTPFVSGTDTFPKPVYERYYSTPQAVHDTFYTAFTQSSHEYVFDKYYGIWYWSAVRPVFTCLCFCPADMNLWVYYEEVVAYLAQEGLNMQPRWKFRRNHTHCAYYIFPILTPAPDPGEPDDPENPEEPGDTTAIGGVDMVSRYVAVQPNPATEEARVLSSFGLQRIEAFDGGGRQMLDVQAEGMQAVLDVRGWAGGTYLLRITTPMGTTTKKLIKN